MKFSIILTLITTLNVSASLYSQDTKLNLSVKDKTVKEVIKLIENQSNFRFFFSDDYLDLNKKVSLTAQNKNINEVLNDLLVEGSVTYKVLDNNVVVITPAAAQQVKVSGTITDASTGESLPGVNVVVKGTTRGTTSDIDGKFTIEVNNGEVLVFSYVGYLSEEVVTAGQSNLEVKLSPDIQKLDEVVVVGYGTLKKKDLTGAVSSIKSEEITKVASSNALQAMQAKMPGMDIRQTSGEAGSGVNISMRGLRSLSANNSPLILVDGVEYGSTLDISPSDIESIDVLKDASSTAIYGTKGANGVIIITTKRGKAGKSVVNLNAFLSSNIPTNVPQVMFGTREVQRLVDKANYQADLASGNWGTSDIAPESILTLSLEDGTTELSIYQDGSYTNWADILLQNGLTQNYELSASGGSEATQYNLSLGTMFEEGLLKNDALDRYNAKLNLDHTINKVFKTGGSIFYTYKDHNRRNSSVFGRSMNMTSITHPYLNDGSIYKTPNPRYAAHSNPLLDDVDGAYQHNILSSRFFGNAYIDITPIKAIVFKSSFAFDRINEKIGIYQDYETVARLQSPTTSYINSSNEYTSKYTWDNTLNINTKLGSPSSILNLLIGQSAMQSINEYSSVEGDCGKEHYYVNAFYDLKKITNPVVFSSFTKQNMLSFFGRANYQLNEKYLFAASLRADGSSTLAPGKKWGYFPSLSAGWRISNESFMQGFNDWLNNLKLRLSWGISGNAAIPPYKTLNVLGNTPIYYFIDNREYVGYLPSQIGNENLSWETTSAYNYGLDFGLLNNRISGTIEYFTSKTTDLLYFKSAPSSSVFPSVIDNIGSTEAQGIEISLSTAILKTKELTWDIDWSYTSYKDKVTYLSEGVDRNITGRTGFIVGEPLSIYFDYESNGCWGVGEYATYLADWQLRHPDESPAYIAAYGVPGTIKIVDKNDDGKLDDEDKVVYNRAPKHILGMNNNISYKNLNLSFLVYARLGGYISYDMNSQLNYESANWGDLDYWTPTNTAAKFPSPGAASATFSNYGTSLLYEKADFVKIKDITLSYNLPTKYIGAIGLSKVKIYGSLKNFLTFSSIDNYDPERDGAISFPLAKQAVFGVNVQF